MKEPTASFTAEAEVAVFKVAFGRWIEEKNKQDLADLIRESLAELKVVARGR